MRVLVALALLLLAGCVTDAPDSETEPVSLFTDTAVIEGDFDTNVMHTLQPGPYGIGSSEAVVLQSDLDGVDIEMLLIRPGVEGPVPVIVVASPYFLPFAELKGDPEGWMINWEADLLSHGFAWAYLSVRGSAGSGGCNDLIGHAERHDIDQAITWLGTQDWSNGNVGMAGGSYDANTQWAAASMGNPHLKTIVPLAGTPSNFHEFAYNGSVKAWTPAQYYGIYWLLYGSGALGVPGGNERTPTHTVELATCPGAAEQMAASTESFLTGETDALGMWEERDYRDEIVENFEGSVFLISGFQDITVEPHGVFPFMERLEAKGLPIKYLVGPWGHENAWRADQAEMVLRWMDHWLRGNTDADLGPKALVMDTAGAWRAETIWPPLDAAPTTWHLCGEGFCDQPSQGSAQMVPTAAVPPTQYLSWFNNPWRQWDQPAATACPTCPSFSTGPLAESLHFAGMPRLHLQVTPQGPGGHVTALLHVVDEAGESKRVGMSIMDLRFRDGDGVSRSVMPGEAVTAKMQFQPLDVQVPAGSELVLSIHQGGYGVRWPGVPTYPAGLAYEGSTFTVDALALDADDFHEAPRRAGLDAPPR